MGVHFYGKRWVRGVLAWEGACVGREGSVLCGGGERTEGRAVLGG